MVKNCEMTMSKLFPIVMYRKRGANFSYRPMASKPQVGLVRSRWEMRNQHDVPVLTMEGWGMFGRRPDVAGVAADVSVPAAP